MEDPKETWKKLRSAVTDVGGTAEGTMSPGVESLFLLLRMTAPEEVTESYLERYRSGEPMYGDLKKAVRDHLEETLRPIRERRAELEDGEVRKVLADGAERASAIARKTMAEVRDLVGVGPAVLDRV